MAWFGPICFSSAHLPSAHGFYFYDSRHSLARMASDLQIVSDLWLSVVPVRTTSDSISMTAAPRAGKFRVHCKSNDSLYVLWICFPFRETRMWYSLTADPVGGRARGELAASEWAGKMRFRSVPCRVFSIENMGYILHFSKVLIFYTSNTFSTHGQSVS